MPNDLQEPCGGHDQRMPVNIAILAQGAAELRNARPVNAMLGAFALGSVSEVTGQVRRVRRR